MNENKLEDMKSIKRRFQTRSCFTNALSNKNDQLSSKSEVVFLGLDVAFILLYDIVEMEMGNKFLPPLTRPLSLRSICPAPFLPLVLLCLLLP
jgi:hypothetical protein